MWYNDYKEKTPITYYIKSLEAVCVNVPIREHVSVRERHLYPAEHAGIEDVHAGVDLIGHKHLRFLHEAMYSSALLLEHHHTVLRGLLHPRHLEAHARKHKPWIVHITLENGFYYLRGGV